MVFQILLGGLPHLRQLFGQPKRKVLGSHIHQNSILRHVKGGLLGIHVLLGGIVGGINLEARKDRPDGCQAGIEEQLILDLHPKISFLYLFLGRIRILLHGIAVFLSSGLGNAVYRTAQFLLCKGFGLSLGHSHSKGSIVSLVIGLAGLLVSLQVGHGVSRIGSGSPHAFGKRPQRSLNIPQIDVYGIVNPRDACTQAHRGHKTGTGLALGAFGHFHLGLFSHYL